MVKGSYFDKSGTKKGTWSEDEDKKLRAYIEKYGHHKWRELPKLAGLSRCGKSCRLRWMNYLRPNVKRGNYTNEEEDLIINLHKDLGNKWSVIASKLQGRTDNDIKNYWHTHLIKRARQNKFVADSQKEIVQDPKSDEESLSEANNERSSVLSSNNLGFVASNEGSSQPFKEELTGDFWTEPFLVDTCSSIWNEYLVTPMDVNKSSFGDDMITVDDYLEFCDL